jgi:hypothetical protein
MAQKKSPLQWWMIEGRRFPLLQMIAVKVFSMTTSSAASERNFSTMGFIHTKLCNRLSPGTFEKLVFIRSNLVALENYPVPDAEMLDGWDDAGYSYKDDEVFYPVDLE